MAFPVPVPGLVIRYSYLWASEHARGQEEGVKDRPYGVDLLPAGKRRSALAAVIEDMLGEDFTGRILSFDSAAAAAFADIAARRRQAGRPIAQADAQIAAIAQSRGAALATRNVPDFEGCSVKIVNPWETAEL